METWRPLLGNDAYEASSYGRIRGVGPKTRGKIIAGNKTGVGYLNVRLSPNMKKRPSVHRLVWEAFRGPIPDGLEINHKNGVKDDNRLGNLEVVSRRANVLHAIRIGLFDPQECASRTETFHFGEANPAARLTEKDVLAIRRLRKTGMNAQAIARQLGLKYRTVQHVVAGNYWSHVK